MPPCRAARPAGWLVRVGVRGAVCWRCRCVPFEPGRDYLAAPVWLGSFSLDPLNARAGEESILGDWRGGGPGRLVNLLIAGLICGLLWEFWNYWGGTKWIYNVPILPNVKIFEMPILGFARTSAASPSSAS